MKRIMIEPPDGSNVGQEGQRGIDLLRDAKIILMRELARSGCMGFSFADDTDADAALGTLRAEGIKASISKLRDHCPQACDESD
jgi:hypothetical protein